MGYAGARNVAATRAQCPRPMVGLVHRDQEQLQMAIIETGTRDIRELDNRIRGYAIAPGEERWDDARSAWNLAAEQNPAAVVYPRDADDVAAIVRFAGDAGLQVTAQGTGHNGAAHGDRLADSILVKTSQMQGVSVDPVTRTARVAAGVLWQDVVPQAVAHGMLPLHGSSPDIGVVGYSLGGGIGYLGRKHGIATNSVTAIELVNADGELVRVDASHDPELFWALRGGGGNYGVVTAMEFELYPVESLYAGMMLWPVEESSRVYKRWRDWSETAPEEITSTARMIQFPEFPDVPEPLRGRHMFVFTAAYMGDPDTGRLLVDPLRELGPEMDMFAPMPLDALMRLHGDPEFPVPFASDHALIDSLPDVAIDDIVEMTGAGTGSPLLMVEFRQMGGAFARTPDGAGALDKVDATYVAFTGGMTPDEESHRFVDRAARDAMGVLAPYSRGRTYLNFSERITNTRSAYSVDTHRRLQAVKARVDADGLFHGNHRIDASAS
jgi:FAD/FMN-containing dehydrogenase